MTNNNKNIYEKWKSIEIEPGVRCSSFTPNGEFIATPANHPDIRTSWDVFKHGLAIAAKRNCLGWRSGPGYEWWTYENVAKRVRQICAAFKTKTPSLSRQQFVGIYATSCPNWAVCALAINARSMCVIPLYDSLGGEARSYIINQVEMAVIFVDSPNAVEKLLESAKETPTLKTIVCFNRDLSQQLLTKAQENSVTLTTLDDFMSGVDIDEAGIYDEPNDSDIAVVQYTSGTTGLPKGVIITHRAYLANVVGVNHPFTLNFDWNFSISENDATLLFLPLAHMYGQLICTWFYLNGGAIGFYGGNVLKIIEDAAILKPTFMALVPRIMNRLYTKVKSEIGTTGFKARLFWYCYNRKKDLIQQGYINQWTVWDFIAFRRIQQLLGGQIRIISVGSAPISADVLEFWRVCFGCLVAEGYGQSECSVIATMAVGPEGGNVGMPLVCNHLKLVDAEECGYFVKDGKGEVCIRGPNVMSGYYKQPDKTPEALDSDGWLHTGDIGEFLPDGALRIFDRKKHIFKLSQGEYIAPEKVENVYLISPLISQIFVDGSTLETFIVAIVVPDGKEAHLWAKANNVDIGDVYSNAEFQNFIFKELTKVGKENKLNSLEQVKNIYLTQEPFSTTNGLLTPSMKNKRPQLRRFFKDQIDAMYKAGPLDSNKENGNIPKNN